jgi:hypothetical protein
MRDIRTMKEARFGADRSFLFRSFQRFMKFEMKKMKTLDASRQEGSQAKNPVGAGLPAKTAAHSVEVLADRPLSPASRAPTEELRRTRSWRATPIPCRSRLAGEGGEGGEGGGTFSRGVS